MRRICDHPQGQFCLVSRVTLPGTYAVHVCAYTEVGVGPTAAGGSVTRFKTYWYCPLPSEQLARLVAPDRRTTFFDLARVVRAYWPGWGHVRGIGVDFRRGDG